MSDFEIVNVGPGEPEAATDADVPHGVPTQPQLPASICIDNPLVSRLRPVLSVKQIGAILNNPGIPELVGSKTASIEQKIAGLALMQSSYRSGGDAARFAQRVIAQVHASYKLRNPEDPRYVKFVYSQAGVLRGAKVTSVPDFLSSLTGSGFILAGPSGCGKTAFLQRLRVLIGEEYLTVQTSHGEFTFLPILILRWPDCGTLSGFLVNLREALIGELGLASIEGIFRNIGGSNAGNAAIAVCVLLNLGLLVIDGMCLRSLRHEVREILDFISTFKERTGIPTLISCTYPALQVISRAGSKQAHLGSTDQEYWDLVPPGIEWNKICESFWKLGPNPAELQMPGYLTDLMWDVSLGNMRILKAAFSALHHQYAYEPELAVTGTRADLADILDVKLRLFKEPLSVMAQFQQMGTIAPDDFLAYADYLPHDVFSKTPSGEFERQLRLTSGRRRVKL